MPGATPRVGVATPDLAESLRAAGAEPVPLDLPEGRPKGGVALAREWVADATEVSCAGQLLDGLLLAAEEPEELAGLVLAALRLNLPSVVASRGDAHLFAALAALGLSPPTGDPVPEAVEVARSGGPRSGDLVDEFSLVNALRAGLSLGGGPQLLVHLSAIAREAGSSGFSQTLRVITPETPLLAAPDSGWFAEHGTVGLLASLGDALNDTATVAGRLREILPSEVPGPPQAAGSHLTFIEARASGAVAVCRALEGVTEAVGECRVFGSEVDAVIAVRQGEVGEGTILVVGGCGPHGGPGLLKLDALGQALREMELEVPVLTDGLSPEDARGPWISLFTPEAAAGAVLSRLQDGDSLRIDLSDGRIRTGVRVEEFEAREPREYPDRAGTGYAARYAKTALPALEGAGFG